MKRNTLLLSVLGVLGLLAAWYFLVRKASAADPLSDALTSGDTSTSTGTSTGTLSAGGSTLSGTGGTDLLSAFTNLVTSLTSTSPASTSPAPTSSTPLTWAKVKQGAFNLWTNLTTGQQVKLDKGHNPNKPQTLQRADYLRIGGITTEPYSPYPGAPGYTVTPNRAVKVKPGFTIPAGVTPPTNPAPAPPSTRTSSPANVRTK